MSFYTIGKAIENFNGPPSGGLTTQDMDTWTHGHIEWKPCHRLKAPRMYSTGKSVLPVVRAVALYEDRQFLLLSGGKQIIQASIAKQKAKYQP